MSEFHKTKVPIEVDIGDVTPANIEQLKAINVNTLPGKYIYIVLKKLFFICTPYDNDIDAYR